MEFGMEMRMPHGRRRSAFSSAEVKENEIAIDTLLPLTGKPQDRKVMGCPFFDIDTRSVNSQPPTWSKAHQDRNQSSQK
jgi:hypothetical protein